MTLPGKLSIMSPVFTATTPSLVTANLILLQIITGFTWFKYFAHGNLFMIFTEVWTAGQWLLMYLLLWNEDWYLYDLRIVRFLSLAGAITFMIFYMAGVAVEVDLLVVEGIINNTDSWFTMLMALIFGELVLYYSPTALVNTFIILKESTLNQLAWRKRDDFREGEVYNQFNMDLLYWLGVDEDVHHHLWWLANWSHEFL